MKRVLAMMAVAAAVSAGGCGLNTYESRMNDTVTQLKYEAKLNSFLEKAAQGKFSEQNVWLRVPKPMVEDKLGLNTNPGSFDHGATFTGAPAAPAAKEGETPPVLPPMKLHVLVRQKAKKAAPKKGQPAPQADPNAAARGNFVADVKGILGAEYGPEGASDKSPVAAKKGGNNFKELKFAAANGDDVRVYFADANRGELETALIFDIPPALRTTPMVRDGIDYCLKSFALGTPARNLFNGKPTAGSKGSGGEGEASGF